MTKIAFRSTIRTGSVPFWTAALLLALAGCGDDSGLPTRYPVSGTVNHNGAPLEKGKIDFIPTSTEGRAATGRIENGKFSITTLNPDDGAIPGSYQVTISSREADASKVAATAKGGQFHHDPSFFKGVKTAKLLVPAKYSLPATSGLTAEVKPQSNTFTFDIKD